MSRPTHRFARLVAVGGAALCLVASDRARAGEIVTYEAPSDCPAAAAVEAKLGDAVVERIRIRREDGTYRGEIVLGKRDPIVRAVDAKDCAAVVDALTLVASLGAFGASDDATPGDTPRSDMPSAAPSVAPNAAPAPRDASTHDAPASPAPRPEIAPARAPRLSFGLGGSRVMFDGDDSFTGGFLFADARARRGAFGLGVLVPSARVGVHRTLPLEKPRAFTVVRFIVTTVRADACPVGGVLPRGFDFAVCGVVEVGALAARASGVTAERARTWWTLGAEARVRYLVGDARQPFVEIAGGLAAPMGRDRYHVLDEVIVASGIRASASLAAGVSLP